MCGHNLGNHRIVAVFSDIHSNYHAFRACFEDAVRLGADSFIFLGDYVSDLASPRQTMDLVYEIQAEYPTVCLRGNRERYMLDRAKGTAAFFRGSKTGSLLYTYERLRPRDLDFFESLKISDTIRFGGIPIELAHASKEDDRYYFEEGTPQIQSIFAGMDCQYLLTGHSHKQYLARCGGKVIVNPGSVGIPQGGSRWPSYGLMWLEGESVSFRLRQVPYDLTAVIHDQFVSGLVEYGGCWAVSMLYDVITCEEKTIELLGLVQQGDVSDEDLWRATAAQMGMKFTEREILEFAWEANRS